jgi:hypothetical protein
MIAQTLAALLTPGASGTTVLASPATGEAKKNTSNAKKKAKQRCQRQEGQCNAVVGPLCGDNAACLVQTQACCGLLAACDADGFFTCINGVTV